MDITAATPYPDISETSTTKARQLQQQVKNSSGLTDKQRQQAKKVSQDFEALMVNMMIKSMRTTVGKDTLTGGGHGEEVYRSMLDQEYAAASVKRGGGLGLARVIEKDIIRQESLKISKKVDHLE
jgi:flagellar protein FlgJ